MCKVFPSTSLEAKMTMYVSPSVSTSCTLVFCLSAKGRGGKQKINDLLRAPALQKGCESVNQGARARPPSRSFFRVSPSWFLPLLRLL